MKRLVQSSDIIVDDQGQFRYLAIDLGFWIFGKKYCAPVGRTQIDHEANRSMPLGWQEEQAGFTWVPNRPQNLDYDHEEQVRVYRNQAAAAAPTTGYRICASTPLTTVTAYEQDASLWDLNAENNQNKLYQERLVANKQRVKTGK